MDSNRNDKYKIARTNIIQDQARQKKIYDAKIHRERYVGCLFVFYTLVLVLILSYERKFYDHKLQPTVVYDHNCQMKIKNRWFDFVRID